MADPAFERLSLRDLLMLQVLPRECSITGAAEVLETTQPQVSKRLAYLRSRFADRLLVRDGQAMHVRSEREFEQVPANHERA
jgi:DNA-binding transcriptional LysR family regulator